jgi:hypothetical protein
MPFACILRRSQRFTPLTDFECSNAWSEQFFGVHLYTKTKIKIGIDCWIGFNAVVFVVVMVSVHVKNSPFVLLLLKIENISSFGYEMQYNLHLQTLGILVCLSAPTNLWIAVAFSQLLNAGR